MQYKIGDDTFQVYVVTEEDLDYHETLDPNDVGCEYILVQGCMQFIEKQYTYSDLSEHAKAIASSEYFDISDDLELLEEEFSGECESYGMDVEKIDHTCSYSQGDGSRVTGSVEVQKFWTATKSEDEYELLPELYAQGYGDVITIYANDHMHTHDMTMSVDTSHAWQNLCGFATESIDAELDELGDSILEKFRELSRDFHYKVVCVYDQRMDDELLTEYFIDNLFDKDGHILQ